MRVGLGFDVHPFGADGTLVLGGVSLEGRMLVGHSDADAVAHAVADALLGPVGLPDLGALFPADDEETRAAVSIEMLRDVAARVARAGWRVENVDVVVAAEEPKLAPYLDRMRANIAAALVPAGDAHVSITPKHGEGVGAVGRGEGVAVWAVALLEPITRH